MHEHEPSVLATLAQLRSNFVRIDDRVSERALAVHRHLKPLKKTELQYK